MKKWGLTGTLLEDCDYTLDEEGNQGNHFFQTELQPYGISNNDGAEITKTKASLLKKSKKNQCPKNRSETSSKAVPRGHTAHPKLDPISSKSQHDASITSPKTLSISSLHENENDIAVISNRIRSAPLSKIPGSRCDLTSATLSSRRTRFLEDGEERIDDNEDGESMKDTVISTVTDTGVFEEEDYDTDLEMDEKDEHLKCSTPADIYVKECERNKTLPASFLIRKLDDGLVKMRHHYLGPDGAKALAKALQNNIIVDSLDVADNYFGEQGCTKLANVLKDNDVISSLNMSMNFMGPKASAAFANMLEINMSLKTLKLQANQLKDRDAGYIGEALKNNLSLSSLDLSNNEIGDEGAIAIAEGLAGNVGLSDLDMSWNCFRERGAASIAKALFTNKMLEILDLSWTCVGEIGSRAFNKAFQINTRLKVLDISNCRVNFDQLSMLLSGFQSNSTIESFLLNGNPVTDKGVDLIISTLRKCKQLRFLSIEDIPLTPLHLKKLKKLETDIPGLIAMHSGVNGLLKKRQLTSVLILFDRFLEEHRETMIDLFRALDSNGSGDVTLEELKLGFKEHGLRLTNRLIDMLLDEIDQDNSGTIEYEELMNAVAIARSTGEKQMILADPMNALQKIRERRERLEAEERAADEARRLRDEAIEAQKRQELLERIEAEAREHLAEKEAKERELNDNISEEEDLEICDPNSNSVEENNDDQKDTEITENAEGENVLQDEHICEETINSVNTE